MLSIKRSVPLPLAAIAALGGCASVGDDAPEPPRVAATRSALACTGGYTATFLAHHNDLYNAVPLGISANGRVSGKATLDGTGWQVGFTWSAATGMQPMGTLGGHGSTGSSINDAGRIAGSSFLPLQTAGDLRLRAVVFDPGAGLTDLGTLGGDGIEGSMARGVNAAGVVVGGSSLASGHRRAFTWSNGALTVLPIHATGFNADAFAINDAGVVVGNADHDQISHAAKWENGVLTNLGAPEGLGGTGNALAISNNGIIVGQASKPGLRTAAVVFLGDSHGTPEEVIELPLLDNHVSARANGVNDSGQIVGEVFQTAGLPQRAVVWQGNEVYQLDTLDNDPTLTLLAANAINDAGQIVARGTRGTVETQGAYLLTPVDCGSPRELKSIETQVGGGFAVPAGTTAGDLILATFEYDDHPSALIAPLGWTKIADQTAGLGTDDAYHAVVYAHRVTTTEPGGHEFIVPDGVWIGTTIAVYGGVSRVAAAASTFADDTTDIAAPSVPASANDLLVTFLVDWDGGTWTGPAGSTWRSEFAGNAVFDTVVTASGPMGPRAASNDTTSDLAAVSIVLR